MRRIVVLLMALLAGPGVAQQGPGTEFSAIARLDVAQSQLRDRSNGMELILQMSQPVPYRVFTLDDPRRLVLDFRELDFSGATPVGLRNSDRALDLRFGPLRPGWSRLVVGLAAPLVLQQAGMTVDSSNGAARLRVIMNDSTEEAFAAAVGAPTDPAWPDEASLTEPMRDGTAVSDILVVAIDPGHGGVDPGAERGGLKEADLMLQLGRELAEAVARSEGMRPVMTREADVFVPLAERMSIARAAGADVLLSLHADALELDQASGASVYTLSADALDAASARMAERHDQGDLLAGLDLSGQDDTVATVLMDMARLETAPRGQRLADTLVEGLGEAGARLNGQPRREGPLAVLNAADFPSVLIEAGFLSSDRDRAALSTPAGRAPIVAGIVLALEKWVVDEAARAALVRQ